MVFKLNCLPNRKKLGHSNWRIGVGQQTGKMVDLFWISNTPKHTGKK